MGCGFYAGRCPLQDEKIGINVLKCVIIFADRAQLWCGEMPSLDYTKKMPIIWNVWSCVQIGHVCDVGRSPVWDRGEVCNRGEMYSPRWRRKHWWFEMCDCVCRRDTIVTRGDAQSKMKKKVLTKGTFERQMAELRKKIKSTIQVEDSEVILS